MLFAISLGKLAGAAKSLPKASPTGKPLVVKEFLKPKAGGPLEIVEFLDDAPNKVEIAPSKLPASQTGKTKSLFEEFGVKPGQGLNLDVASAPDGQSYITYAFKDGSGNVVYVGRASGPGTPRKVLADRLRKGHEHFKDGLVPEVVDVQGSKLASQGAEEVFIQGFREQGAKLTNVDEALSFNRKERIQKSLEKVEAYLEDLKQRKTQ